MAKRIKAPSLKSVAEFNAALDELARTTVSLRKAEARRDAKIQEVRDEYDPDCIDLAEKRDALLLSAEKYAEANREAVLPGKLKSGETTLSIFGFRLGNPTLKTLNKAWTWERVLETLRELKLTAYIREKSEVDKDALKTKAKPEELAKVGCRIDQDETFFVEPKEAASSEAA